QGQAAVAAAAAASLVLGAKPLVPSALVAVLRKFRPQLAGLGPVAPVQAGLSLAQRLALKTGAGGGGAGPQEQQDAQEFLHFLLDHTHEELLQLRKV
ncbi:USP domain-containing protein, partial [Haematococcus lacustris]